MSYVNKLKYQLPIISITLLGLWFGFYYLTDYKFGWTVFIPLVGDFTLRYLFYRGVRQREVNHTLLFVKHKRWHEILGLPVIFGVLLIAGILFYVFVVKNFDGMIGVLLPGYVVVQSGFFHNGFDGYLMTEHGINQIGIFEKDYAWKDIEDICVTEKALYITINSEELTTKIEKGMADRVMEYLRIHHIAFRS